MTKPLFSAEITTNPSALDQWTAPSPTFIIGCGRSGTTIFGKLLARHRRVTYLNEPRKLWAEAYPETDIWTPFAKARNGKLVLTEADALPDKSEKLHQLFRQRLKLPQKPVLVEKLPINNFRLPFLHAIFPDAKFIHIQRNGLEVARSIEAMSAKNRWFAPDSYKWFQLQQYAMASEATADLPGICNNAYEKGLLEWRLSTEAAKQYLGSLPNDRCYGLTYDALLDNTEVVLTEVMDFIGLKFDPKIINYALKNLDRRSEKLAATNLSAKELQIGGELLKSWFTGDKAT